MELFKPNSSPSQILLKQTNTKTKRNRKRDYLSYLTVNKIRLGNFQGLSGAPLCVSVGCIHGGISEGETYVLKVEGTIQQF